MTAGVLDVFVNDGFAVMVDDSLVYLRGYGDRPTLRSDPHPALRLSPTVLTATGQVVRSRTYPLGAPLPPGGRPTPLQPDPAFPGQYLPRRAYWASFLPQRTLLVETGSRIRLRVHNTLAQPHTLAVPGVLTTGAIPPGGYRDVDVPAPAPGTYVYLDPGNPPVERVLGLYGALLVVPVADKWRLTAGGTEFERQWVWQCHDIDPAWSRIAAGGGTVDPARTPVQPRYFTLNDRSGFRSLAVSTDAAQNEASHEETLPSGFPREIDVRDWSRAKAPGTVQAGQLVRMVNAGVVVHQMHFHGNHVWTVRRNGSDFGRSGGGVDAEGHVLLQQWEDVVELDPLDRKEVVLPVRRPPEAIDQVWEARAVDWTYPMHCHAEPSQTAAGGLYPGGLVADWSLAAPSPTPGGTP